MSIKCRGVGCSYALKQTVSCSTTRFWSETILNNSVFLTSHGVWGNGVAHESQRGGGNPPLSILEIFINNIENLKQIWRKGRGVYTNQITQNAFLKSYQIPLCGALCKNKSVNNLSIEKTIA